MMLSYIRNGRAWVMVVAVVLTFAIGTPYTFAGQPVVVPAKDKQFSQAPQPLSQTEVVQLTRRDSLNSSLRNIVAGQGSRTCDGCGGSGLAVDYNRRHRIPLGTTYDKGKCPKCNGTGRLQNMEGLGEAISKSDDSGLMALGLLAGLVILAAMAADAPSN